MFSLFKSKSKEAPQPASRYLTLSVREVIRETDEAITIVFEKQFSAFTYKPGQYITLILQVGEGEVRRAYSLCTTPVTDANPAITVKRVGEGLVSNLLNRPVKPGDEFRALEPMGSFTPDLDASARRQHVFIGGGSGITPLFSIIKSVLHVEKQSRVVLIYQNRDENSVIFRAAIDELQAQHADRFTVEHILSKPSLDWTGLRGRLDGAMLHRLLHQKVEGHIRETQFYLCGPAGLMQTAEDTLFSWKVAGNQIRKESFVAGPAKSTEIVDTAAEPHIVEQQVSILLDGDEHQVAVPAGKSILQAALDAGLDMPFSCQSGLCTACRGKLLSGKVYMEEDDGLTDAEIAEGYVLNCVGHPLTTDVRIEIG